MAKLILNPTSSTRREIRLQRTLMSIGRDPSNDLILPDAMVSRRHAVIEYRETQYFLRDCNSSNGSVVNGDKVNERGLRDGDLLAIGTARLLFREEVELEDPAAKVVPHPSVPRLQCPACQADYRRGDLFCRECGAQVAMPSGPPKVVCAACGTAVLLPARFCSACGATLNPDVERMEATKPHSSSEPAPADPSPPPEPEASADLEPAPEAVNDGGQRTSAPPPRAEAVEKKSAPMVVEPSVRPSGAIAAVAPAVAPPRRRRPEKPAERTVPPPPDRRLFAGSSPPVGVGPRLLAGVVDATAVVVAQAAVASPLVYFWWGRTQPDVSFLPILLSVGHVPIAAFLGVGYYSYFCGIRGATPGQRLLGLTVESDRGRSPIGVSSALLRLFGYALSAATLGIGFLMIVRDGRGLHDRIAGTRVVRRRGE